MTFCPKQNLKAPDLFGRFFFCVPVSQPKKFFVSSEGEAPAEPKKILEARIPAMSENFFVLPERV